MRLTTLFILLTIVAAPCRANPLLDEPCPPVAAPAPQAGAAQTIRQYDFFTNHGSYMPRTHCMVTQQGETDWPWVIGLVVVTLSVIALYMRIYVFWRRCYHEEDPRDRNPAMMRLANIFFWCAVCGYAMSITMFVWPAYRLLTMFLCILSIWSWKFVINISDFRISLSARRLERELRETLESRNRELEQLVAARTDELEEAKRSAEDANAAKSLFLANMSHEIRTPITSVMGYADLALRDVPEQSDTAGALHTISRNANHLLTLVNDVLDISKIEAGEMPIEHLDVSTAEVIEEAIDVIAPRAHQKGIKLVKRLDTPIPRTINTDPTRIKQALINLLTNAVKFTDEGSITLAASMIDTEQGPRLRFDVIDTGVGIPADRIEAIFEPFKQADDSTTRQFGGTGLGLTITREIARMLGGELTVTSAPGKGSTFTIAVDPGDTANKPVFDSIEQLATEATRRMPLFAGSISGRILLAEDSPDIARLVTTLLQRAGASVEVAPTGPEALAKAQSGEAYDLVILDGGLPGMSGVEITGRLRDAGLNTPIIAFTANAMMGEKDRWFQAGCSDYLAKPAKPSELISMCAKWLNEPSRAAA